MCEIQRKAGLSACSFRATWLSSTVRFCHAAADRCRQRAPPPCHAPTKARKEWDARGCASRSPLLLSAHRLNLMHGTGALRTAKFFHPVQLVLPGCHVSMQ